jgi:hypothetical protein
VELPGALQLRDRHQPARTVVIAVRRDEINLFARVHGALVTVGRSPTAASLDHDRTVSEPGALALHTMEPAGDLESQVVAGMLRLRPEDVHSRPKRAKSDRSLRDVSDVVRVNLHERMFPSR